MRQVKRAYSADRPFLGRMVKVYPFFSLAVVFLFVLVIIIMRSSKIEIGLIEITTALNIVAFLLFGHDKDAARAGAFRVPERIFFGLALLGAAPGIIVGMKYFRHKTRKAGFVFLVGVLAVFQLWALWYLAPPSPNDHGNRITTVQQ